MRSRLVGPLLLALVASLLALPAWSQPYDLAWHTVDGGGATFSTGGSFSLGGTIGQPDAGGPFTSSPYTLHSGFWALLAGGSGGPEADLAIAKSDGLGSAVPGLSVIYTITVTNAGPSTASGASVGDSLPASLLNATWTCSASSGASCTASGSGGISDTVNLPAGGTLTYTLAATVSPGAVGTLGNTATVGTPAGLVDPNLANNASTDTDTLTPLADLGVTQSDAPDPVGPYGTVTWTLTAANAGPSNASALTLTDTLPGQVTFVSSTPACTHLGGTVTCNLGALPAGQQTGVQVTATVNPGFVGTLTNGASVAGAESDPTGANNSSNAATQVVFLKGDLNLDVQTDLLLRLGSTGQNEAWLMNGSVRQGAPVAIAPTPPALDWQVFGVDDFNADWRNDLVLRNASTGAVEFWLMNGTSRVGAPVPIGNAATLAADWKLSATADFDHDGRPDIVWRNFSSQAIVIWTMNGTVKLGEIVPTPAQAAHANWEIVGAQDWNGDQNADFLWYNATSGKIVLWFMDQDVVRITGQFTNPANAGDNNWNVLAMGDYGAGAGGLPNTRDIVWRNANSGRFVLWYMDQAGNRTSGLFTTPMEPSPNPTAWTIVGPR
jgi:uncharacterized repeat protein (TIGR01451 family)